MVSNRGSVELSRWEVGNGATVDYSPAVLEELRKRAVDGFVSFGHGGLEVGGVLYGARDETRMKVLGFAPLPCEHALGPGFVLSPNDRKMLATLLKPPIGLQTLGWYRSHTRSGLELDSADHELFADFAAIGRSLALLLKPTHWGHATAAFYLRDAAGAIVPPAAREFTIDAPKRPGRTSAEPEPTEPPVGELPDPAMPEAHEAPPPLPPLDWPLDGGSTSLEERAAMAFRDQDPPPRRWPRYSAILAILLVLAAAGYYSWSRPARGLGLLVLGIAPGQVRIEWDHQSWPLQDASSAVLQVRDGDSFTSIPLDKHQLSTSSIVYTQRNDHITASLHVERREHPAAEEFVEFVGPAASSSTAEAATLPRGRTAKPPDPVASVIDTAKARPVDLYRRIPDPATPQATPPAQARPARPTEMLPASSELLTLPAELRRKAFQPPVTAQRGPDTASTLPAPPPVQVATTQPLMPELIPKTAPVAPAAKPVVRPPAASPAAPAPQSGRLIWTGQLARKGVVEIDGAHASSGSLSGSLTGTQATFHVLPAEFTRDGLTVYTADGKVNGRTEPPSKANGWNSVVYQFDPVRAKELVVLEAPSRANHYSRLVLRSDAKNCPVILVDWTAQ